MSYATLLWRAGYGYLVVGLGVVDTSFGGRRRLLLLASTDDEDDEDRSYTQLRHTVLSFAYWNATKTKLCSALAHAISYEKNLSITDMHALESCVEWRQAGRDAIAQLNLTSLQYMEKEMPWEAPDRLFMSFGDFADIFSQRRTLLLELAYAVPQAVTLLLSRAGFLEPLQKIWQALQRNSLFYAWNVLLLASNETNQTTSFPDTLNVSNFSQQHLRRAVLDKKEVMHVLDQFVLAQHRSMKLLHGGAALVSFLDESEYSVMEELVDAAEKVVENSKEQQDGRLREEKRLGRFRAKDLLLMQLLRNNMSSHLNTSVAGPQSGKRSLLQMDDSIKVC